MNICFLTVLYNTSEKEVLKLNKQCSYLGIKDFFTTDNSKNGKGYAEGVNELLKKYRDKYDLYIIANPDIDISSINKNTFLDASEQFDIWGYSFLQDGKVYYKGEIDTWRMSGGFSTKKPVNRYIQSDFVSGSLMVVKKEVISRIGFLNEEYGMYYEDVDFCYRAALYGFDIGIDSQNIYTHFEESKKNTAKKSYLEKNRLKFLMKYGSKKQKLYELIRLPKTLYEHFT